MLPHKQEAMAAAPDSLVDQLAEVFDHVQRNTGCHQRFIQVLTRLYERSNFAEFVDAFVRILRVLFTSEFKAKCVYLDRSVDFASMFVVKLTEKKEGVDEGGAVETHPFLWHVIKRVLKLSNSVDHRQRQGACNFVTRVLQSISDDTHLDNDICDDIQSSMLERINDPRPTIRVNAILALVRLQEPFSNDSCPVIDAFLTKFDDPHKQVRRVVVHKIAPTPASLLKIAERTRDVSEDVRAMAFRKLSMILPLMLKISDRQGVILAGFHEHNRNVKRVFLEVMLPKWLTGYEGNFLKFLSAISLDADEDDVATTEMLSKWTMEQFFKAHQIQNIIDCLPIGEDKLVPLDKLTAEVVNYWSVLQDHLGKTEELDEYLATILPDLLPFCNYIESFIAKHEDQESERWRHLMDNFILRKLVEMAGRFDLSDEVGRKKLYQLVTHTLVQKLDTAVVYNLIILLEKLTADFQHFLEDICDIISNIKEPVVVQEVTDEEMRQWNYQMATLKVQKNIFLEDVEDSIAKRELKMAAEKEEQVKEISRKMDELEANKPVGKKVRRLGDDKQRICQCLDIVNAVLKRPKVVKLTAELKAFKEEFMNDLLSVNDIEVYGKLLRFVANCAMLDKKFAEDNLKMLCTPIITYQLQPVYQNDKKTLMTSIHALTDLLRLYNTSIFEGDAVNSTGMEQQNKRKLYRPLEEGSTEIFEPKSYALEMLIDCVVSMLDDECQDIRDCAGDCISHLLFHGIMISPTLLSRILIKIFNPLTEKQNPKLQQLFVASILEFALKVPESADTFEKAIIPTLNVIGNAPKTSPLADINIDRLIEFLTTYTSSITNNGIVDSHKNLAYSLCNQLVKNPESKCVPIWLKMLLSLNVPRDDETALKEIAAHVDAILEEITDKNPRVKLKKYQATLLDCLKDLQRDEVAPDPQASDREENMQVNNDLAKKRGRDDNLEENSGRSTPEATPKKQRTLLPIDALDAPRESPKSTLPEKEKRNLSANAGGDASSKSNAVAANKKIRVLDVHVIKPKKNQESDKPTQASSSPNIASGRSPRSIVNKQYWLKDSDRAKVDKGVAKKLNVNDMDKSANSEPSLSPVRSKRVDSKPSPRQSRKDNFLSTRQTNLRRSQTSSSSTSNNRPSLSGSTRGIPNSDAVSRKSDRISRTKSSTSSSDSRKSVNAKTPKSDASKKVDSVKSGTSPVKGTLKKKPVKRQRVETSSESGSTRRSLRKNQSRTLRDKSNSGKPKATTANTLSKKQEQGRPVRRKNIGESPVQKEQVDTTLNKKQERGRPIKRKNVGSDSGESKKELLNSQSSQSSTSTRSTSRKNTDATDSQTTSGGSIIKSARGRPEGSFKRKRSSGRFLSAGKQKSVKSTADKLGNSVDKNSTNSSDTEDSQNNARRPSRRRLDFVNKQQKNNVKKAKIDSDSGSSRKVLRKSSRSRNKNTDSDAETSIIDRLKILNKSPKKIAESAGKGKTKPEGSSATNKSSHSQTSKRSAISATTRTDSRSLRSSSAGSSKKIEAICSPLVIIEKARIEDKLTPKKDAVSKKQVGSSESSQSPVMSNSSSRRSLRNQDEIDVKSDGTKQNSRLPHTRSTRNEAGKSETPIKKVNSQKSNSNTSKKTSRSEQSSTESSETTSSPQRRGSRLRTKSETGNPESPLKKLNSQKSSANNMETKTTHSEESSRLQKMRGSRLRSRSETVISQSPLKKVNSQQSNSKKASNSEQSSSESSETTRRSRGRPPKQKQEVTKTKPKVEVTSNVKVKLLRNFGESIKRTHVSSSSESVTSERNLRGRKQTRQVKKAKLNDSSSIFSSRSTRSSLRDKSIISSTD